MTSVATQVRPDRGLVARVRHLATHRTAHEENTHSQAVLAAALKRRHIEEQEAAQGRGEADARADAERIEAETAQAARERMRRRLARHDALKQQRRLHDNPSAKRDAEDRADRSVDEGIDRREGETHAQWAARVNGIRRDVTGVYNEGRLAIRAATPRYLEGWPARETLTPPRAGPHYARRRVLVRTTVAEESGEEEDEEEEAFVEAERCLRCLLGGLRCTRTTRPWWANGSPRGTAGGDKAEEDVKERERKDRKEEETACARCRRHGEQCVTRREVLFQRDTWSSWHFTPAPSAESHDGSPDDAPGLSPDRRASNERTRRPQQREEREAVEKLLTDWAAVTAGAAARAWLAASGCDVMGRATPRTMGTRMVPMPWPSLL